MKLQILSDLHLETEAFEPCPAPGAEALVLAGDIDSRWEALARFQGWPVPVIFVPGNHEFDFRELGQARSALRAHCAALGLHHLDDEQLVLRSAAGRRVRFLGSTRWCDFEAFGSAQQARAIKAAGYFVKIMQARLGDQPLDAAAVRELALASRTWLATALAQAPTDWDDTVVITHYAPSLRSADPRYGEQLSTASFCNADDELIEAASLWIHGHLHCRCDYRVGNTRVVANARGHGKKGEPDGFNPLRVVDVEARTGDT